MNQIQKMLIPFVILALVTSAIAAYETGSDETNITTENISTAGQINGNSNIAPEDMPAEEQNIIPTLITNVAYTNPVTGISIFGKSFDNIHMTYDYNEMYAVWTNYSFYLPVSSYVHIDTNSNYIAFNPFDNVNRINYELIIDGNDRIGGYVDRICDTTYYNSYCNIEFSQSLIFQLDKGYHSVILVGNKMFNIDLTYDAVSGTISIMAFPEYTAITVTSPNGGENWSRGTTKMITWKKDGNPGLNVKIELYKGTLLSTVISSRTSNDGSYSWYIPTYQPIGTDYKIKITSYEEPTKYSDWSNNNFRIY